MDIHMDELLQATIDEGGSDLHVRAYVPPTLRVHGELLPLADEPLSEDDTLLREILFNPHTKPKVEMIRAELKQLIQIIDDRDEDAMTGYLTKIRRNIES